MSNMQKRLKQIALQLTPKQAVLNVLEEHHQQFDSVEEYSRWVSVPKNLAQIYQRWKDAETGVEKATKGKPDHVIRKACQRCREDIVFLLALHNKINGDILEDMNFQDLQLALLSDQLQTFLRESQASYSMIRAIGMTKETTYPLDKETAAIAHDLVRYNVHHLCITDHQVSAWLPDEDNAPMAYRDFKEAVQELVDSGALQGGKTVSFETAPIMGFMDAPLLEGEWVDQVLVEMVEWGALLEKQGYKCKQADDDHPLAMNQYFPADAQWGQETLPEALSTLDLYLHRETVRANWTHYHGETRLIEDRPYIRLSEYRKWRKRFYKGSFGMEEGVMTASWNKWIKTCGGKATISGIKVEPLDYWFDDASYVVCETAIEAFHKRETRREQIALMRNLIVNRYEAGEDCDIDRYRYGLGTRKLPYDPLTFKERLVRWSQFASAITIQHYGRLEGIQRISAQFFDGHTVLFRDTKAILAERGEKIEMLLKGFNTCLAEYLDDSAWKDPELFHLSIENLQPSIQKMGLTVAASTQTRAKLQTLEQLDRPEEAREVIRGMIG